MIKIDEVFEGFLLSLKVYPGILNYFDILLHARIHISPIEGKRN